MPKKKNTSTPGDNKIIVHKVEGKDSVQINMIIDGKLVSYIQFDKDQLDSFIMSLERVKSEIVTSPVNVSVKSSKPLNGHGSFPEIVEE